MASPDSTNNCKYDDASPPSSRRPSGFSAPILPDASAVKKPLSSYNNVPSPATDLELAKLRAQEIADRIRSFKTANGNTGFDHGFVQKPPMPSVAPPMYGFQGGCQESKTIDIPNGRVGVIIGKDGETMNQLQAQSGAKIQVTRKVELVGSPDQIARAELLVQDVLAEAAETGGSGAIPRRVSGLQPGAYQHVTKIPNNKVHQPMATLTSQMKKFVFPCLLVILGVILLCMNTTMRAQVIITTHVSGDIRVHCKSKYGDDKGERILSTGQNYNWSFTPPILKKSLSGLYVCHFYWGDRVQAFEVYNEYVEYNCVDTDIWPNAEWSCLWEVRSDGFFLYNGKTKKGFRKWEKKYDRWQ